MRNKLLLTTSIVILLNISSPIYANTKDDRIQALENALKALTAEVNELKKERLAEKNSAGNNAVKITMKPSPKIVSSDGNYSFQPFGRIHLDLSTFDDDVFDHSNNANFRRARLGFKGKLGKDFKYKSEIDFAGENINFKDVNLSYTGINNTEIKIGSHKPSFGMEQNTSSNYISFIERTSPTNAFTRGHEIGVNILTGGENWLLSGGVFNEDAGNKNTGDDEDITYDFRGSINALSLFSNKTDNALHIGAGISYRKPTGSINFDSKPTGDGSDMVDTGAITLVDNVNIYNLELAGIWNAVSFQSEYFNANISRKNNNIDANFDGYYLQAGWLLTGETKPYNGIVGNFGRIKPNNPFNINNGEWGAWEVLARYESVNLNDASAGIMGGELKSTSLGINWYISNHIRLMSNIIFVNTDNNSVVPNDDPTIYNSRLQWDF